MFGVRRIRPGLAVLFCAILLAAGCQTSSRFEPPPGTGTGTSVAAPVKGAAAKFAFAPIDGVPVPILQAMSNALNQEAAAKRAQCRSELGPSGCLHRPRLPLGGRRRPERQARLCVGRGRPAGHAPPPRHRPGDRRRVQERRPLDRNRHGERHQCRAEDHGFAGQLGEIAPPASRRFALARRPCYIAAALAGGESPPPRASPTVRSRTA